ncbi:MAG TPA: hypothetical protein PKZ84_20880 [Anaerolineae bacterium]|nr:hypothetical protein [Anaerolineae bacterium]HQI87078.1 hypothetical protein [Anaerolineae bacterium]
MKRQWIVWIAVVVLMVVSLGCSLFGAKATKEPGEVAQPTATSQAPASEKETEAQTPQAESEKETPESADESFAIDADALEGLDSYRMQMTWSFTADDGKVEEFSIEEEATRDPVAQRYTMTSADQSIEFIRVGDTQWMRLGEDWMQTSVSADEEIGQFGQFAQPDQIFSTTDKDAYKYLGKETINGIKTRHYQLKENMWNTTWSLTAKEVEEGSLELWVADENDLPKIAVRFEAKVKGTFEDDRKGELFLTWEIFDVNADITIEPPADAEGMGLPEGLELCPDSSDLTVMGKMTIFTCAGTVEDTAAFYTEALKNAGWEVDGEVTSLEGMMMGNWKKGDETLSLTITKDDDTNGSNVMLTLGE